MQFCICGGSIFMPSPYIHILSDRNIEFLKGAFLLLSMICCLLNVRAIGGICICDTYSIRELLSYSSWGRKLKCKTPIQLFEAPLGAEF